MKTNKPMNHRQYAEMWKKESNLFEAEGIYSKLVDFLPSGKILEVGSGSGKGTRRLASKGEVLSLEINSELIKEAKRYLGEFDVEPNILKCDVLSLDGESLKEIIDFSPKTIVGWFIGSSGIDVTNHVDGESLTDNVKLYREKIEDFISSSEICGECVEVINLVNRGIPLPGLTDEKIAESYKNDYNQHVFNKIGFEVVDVHKLLLPKGSFRYEMTTNKDLKGHENSNLYAYSIIAKRKE